MPADNKKKYGLILASARRAEASSSGASVLRTLNPLQDSDEELEREEEGEQSSMDWVQAALKRSGGGNSAQLAQQQRLMREALQDDASIFQYDEHFDNIQATRDSTKQQKATFQKKEPKYIQNILKSAERRKIEKERRTERKVQAEREAEEGLYDDKESFVTSSYLKKLEELKEAEEKEKMEAAIEENNDVAKHKNMGIFYNHLFKQRMGDEVTTVKTEPEETAAEQESTSTSVHVKRENSSEDGVTSIRDRSRSPTNSKQESSKKSHSESIFNKEKRRPRSPKQKHRSRSKSPKKRRYRSRSSSPQQKHSSDSPPNAKRRQSDSSEKSDAEDENGENTEQEAEENKNENTKQETKEERITRLFTKRTVGEKFIEAQQRYFERKAQREESSRNA